MVIKALIEGLINGVGQYHSTSIFPCAIFQYMKGVNDKPGTPNYDMYRLSLKSTAKRIYPNYANVDWSGNAGYDVNDPKTYFSTMGCRTANGYDINANPGVNPQTKDGRGNICPVTIILPKIAMEAKLKFPDDEDARVLEFQNKLEQKINDAKDMLIERFNWICSQKPESAQFMYENGTMEGYVPEEGIKSALKHGTLAVGQLGLAEALQLLVGCDHVDPRGMTVALTIEDMFKKKCAAFKEEYKLNFGVYYTPAENLCYTAMKKFRNEYGVIEHVSDKDYFTNSIHVPVWHDIDCFQKIDIESKLTGFSSAGCITYVELPSTAIHNIDAIEEIVNYMMDHDIPYGALNFPLDSCADCHAQGDFNGVCPVCGSTNIMELRRVTGYLSTTKKNFNLGKQAEVDDRAKHVSQTLDL
jgi:ribonucleoside-triphosphate reductase